MKYHLHSHLKQFDKFEAGQVLKESSGSCTNNYYAKHHNNNHHHHQHQCQQQQPHQNNSYLSKSLSPRLPSRGEVITGSNGCYASSSSFTNHNDETIPIELSTSNGKNGILNNQQQQQQQQSANGKGDKSTVVETEAVTGEKEMNEVDDGLAGEDEDDEEEDDEEEMMMMMDDEMYEDDEDEEEEDDEEMSDEDDEEEEEDDEDDDEQARSDHQDNSANANNRLSTSNADEPPVAEANHSAGDKSFTNGDNNHNSE